MDSQQHGEQLKRGLKNRHIQLIALGGAIGTGLFLGIGPAIQMAGPAVLLGYGVAGIIAFLIMRQLGEMVVEEPVSGSFAHFAWKYWGPFAGFLSGWNYWVMFVLVGMAELTAAGIYMQYWLPDVPTWVWAAAFFIIINAVNLVNVRLYGETEFWFALIKVLAIIGMGMFLFCFASVRERVRPAVPTHDDMKNDFKDVWKNDQWVRILLLTLCNVCPGFIRMAATMYYVTWVMGQSTHFATLFISLGVVGMMIGSMLAKVLTDRWCKLKVFFWTNIALAIFSCAFYFFDPKATVMIVALYFLLNILHQIPSPLHWSLMADVDDYGEWKTGKRITGISFSGNLFFLKLGLAIAGAMVGFLLSWYGYDASAKAQSASAMNGIMLLFTVIPGVGYLITAGVVRLLKVDRELMKKIQDDLEKRRTNYRELSELQDLNAAESVRKA
ncbi:amino acid permease [Salmonella enterica subsp. enterica serovar Heidelberg]|nr:amino acid permease [Salmonella enterica subsp. enterica serovar Heidelberg]